MIRGWGYTNYVWGGERVHSVSSAIRSGVRMCSSDGACEFVKSTMQGRSSRPAKHLEPSIRPGRGDACNWRRPGWAHAVRRLLSDRPHESVCCTHGPLAVQIAAVATQDGKRFPFLFAHSLARRRAIAEEHAAAETVSQGCVWAPSATREILLSSSNSEQLLNSDEISSWCTSQGERYHVLGLYCQLLQCQAVVFNECSRPIRVGVDELPTSIPIPCRPH